MGVKFKNIFYGYDILWIQIKYKLDIIAIKPSICVDNSQAWTCSLLTSPMALKYDANAIFLLLKQAIKHWPSLSLIFLLCAASFLIFSKLMHSTAHNSNIAELKDYKVVRDD